MAIHDYTPKDVQRFWSKVAITANPDLCWEWQAGRHKQGYGRFKKIRMYLSHRIAWQLTNGNIPDGLDVLHTCDNPCCCNPKHLFLGTHTDNMQDRKQKGRGNHPKGERHGSHKLTRNDVNHIRERYAQGSISLRQLANEYNVFYTTIQKIVKHYIWPD